QSPCGARVYRRYQWIAPRPAARRTLCASAPDGHRLCDARIDGHVGDRARLDARHVGARGCVALRPQGSARPDLDRPHDRPIRARRIAMHILITDSGVGGLSVCAYAERYVRTQGFQEPVRLTFANAAPDNDYGYNAMPSRDAKLHTFDRFLGNVAERY